MQEQTRYDIRMLLKSFGIQADQALTAHMANILPGKVIQVRITLEDTTEYDDPALEGSLGMEIEGKIRG